jgi:hypothetical protein
MVDFALSRMLGLYVVARLAQRYNIKVQLRHSWYGGITALVLLPPTVAVRAPMPEAIEAPSRRGPAELVASAKPAEPAVEEEEGGEHLPIFEAARSDWFEDGVRGDHLPLRRHAAQQPHGRAAEPTGNGAGTLTGAGAARLPDPDGARTDAERAEELRAEAIRAETARMEAAAQAEAAKAETAEAEAEEARPEAAWPGAPTASAAPQAEAGAAPRGDAPRARTGPLPTRTPGASGPPPGGAKPFAPASPAGAESRPSAPASPTPGRSGRRADRTGGDRVRADRVRAGRAPAAQPVPASPEPVPAPAGAAAADVAAAAPTLQAASVQTTKAGLPRRVPRANLAPGMVAAQAAATAARTEPAGDARPASPAARTPEEVRSMLSSYRSGLERGRMAAGEDAERGDNPHSSSRSDHDDATQ